MVGPDIALNRKGRLLHCSLSKVPHKVTKVCKSGLTIFNKLVSMGLKFLLSWRVTSLFDFSADHAQDGQSRSKIPLSMCSHGNSATYR